MKIIRKKEYQRLKDIEEKYNYLIGQTITLFTGKRSRYAGLLSMSKEELVKRYMDLNNIAIKMRKELLKGGIGNE